MKGTVSKEKCDVRAIDLAILAVKLAERSGKAPGEHLAEAGELLARAARLIPDVQRKAHPAAEPKQLTFDEACDTLKVKERTLKKHLRSLGIKIPSKESPLPTGALSRLHESITAARSRR